MKLRAGHDTRSRSQYLKRRVFLRQNDNANGRLIDEKDVADWKLAKG